jgi:hypothetical protein
MRLSPLTTKMNTPLVAKNTHTLITLIPLLRDNKGIRENTGGALPATKGTLSYELRGMSCWRVSKNSQ